MSKGDNAAVDSSHKLPLVQIRGWRSCFPSISLHSNVSKCAVLATELSELEPHHSRLSAGCFGRELSVQAIVDLFLVGNTQLLFTSLPHSRIYKLDGSN